VGEESDGLYPILDSSLNIVPESDDGHRGESVRAMSARVEYFMADDTWETAGSIEEIKMDIYPTSSRVIFYCRKWAHGGFIGSADPLGLVVGATTAIVSGARAASRNKGNALAGHIRWPWVRMVGYKRKTFFSSPAVGIVVAESVSEDAVTFCRVWVEFRLTNTAEAFRDTIIEHCRTYRQTVSDSMSIEERAAWECFEPNDQWRDAGKGLNWLDMPSSTCIGDALPEESSQALAPQALQIPDRPPYPPPPPPPRP
jgi:hypothetical protein